VQPPAATSGYTRLSATSFVFKKSVSRDVDVDIDVDVDVSSLLHIGRCAIWTMLMVIAFKLFQI
jgi:hypothetical protein